MAAVADGKYMGKPTPYGVILAGIIFVILVVIGFALFVSYPTNNYYWGMVLTGLLAVFIGIAFYLFSSFSRGLTLHLASQIAFWFGIAMLLGATFLTPNAAFGASNSLSFQLVPRVWLLVITLIFAGIAVAGMWWQTAAKATVERREDKRAAWRQSTGVAAPGAGDSAFPPPANKR